MSECECESCRFRRELTGISDIVLGDGEAKTATARRISSQFRGDRAQRESQYREDINEEVM